MRRFPSAFLAVVVAAAVAFSAVPSAAAASVRGAPDDGTRSDVYAFGSAPYLGANHSALAQDIVGMAATRTGRGYWLVAADGGVFTFGDARFFGSTGALHLDAPVVGMAATRTGRGYWLVASDGGIFAFGDAHFFGSAGAMRLHQPIVGVAATPTGRGYWLVARDGGIFAFGDAHFFGSTGAMRLHQPIVGMTATRDGRGYWLVARDGGIFAFGSARFHGSVPGAGYASTPIIAIVASPDDAGYWMASRYPIPSARFDAHASLIDEALARRMTPSSWRAGCPVGLGSLRYLTVRHWGFDHRPHDGELVLNADAVIPMLHVLRALWDMRYPVRRMQLIDDYGGSDDASLAADNTSMFNCRPVAGTSRWSEHAFGRAIDIDPVENPYVAGPHVSPPAEAAFLDRTQARPGLIRAGDAVVRAFAEVGWGWGGDFASTKDYQHFSASGR
jgi:hypothetical protein